jgi:propionyl-CoA synthetase
MINDNWWQTESGWSIASNYLNLTKFKTKAGSTTVPCPGWDVKILDEEDNENHNPNFVGKVMVKLPCPPGHMDGLWENDDAYIEKYLSSPEGYYMTGDAGYFDEDGYLYVMTRLDDVINTAGHRLSTGRIEEVLTNNINISECAVVGMDHDLKGEVPVAFIQLQAEVEHESLEKDIQAHVREEIGAFSKLDKIVYVKRLPKTRSGKILRNLLRDIVNNVEKPRVTPTIEDASVVQEVMKAYNDSL